MNNKPGINMEHVEEIKKEMQVIVKIMLELEEFSGRKAVEILTGALCSIITTTANDGKQDEIVEAIIKELKAGIKAVETIKPMVAIIGQLKNKNPNLN